MRQRPTIPPQEYRALIYETCFGRMNDECNVNGVL